MTMVPVIANNGIDIPGVISYSKGSLTDHWKKTMNPVAASSTTSQGAAQPQQAAVPNQPGSPGNNVPGGLMGQFNDLLKQRQGLQNEKMALQEGQLQKVNTQKNNTSVANAFASRNNLVDIMRQLLDASRRTTAAQSRVFT